MAVQYQDSIIGILVLSQNPQSKAISTRSGERCGQRYVHVFMHGLQRMKA
jgi:hypothetical protein